MSEAALKGLALAVSLALPAAASANPEPVQTETTSPAILVTGGRTNLGGGETYPIEREQIAASQAASLLELLDQVPGIRAYAAGGPAGGSVVALRGGEANFTVIMLDGARLNDPTNVEGGAFDFALLDPQTIARIEVLRGAGSAVHGSDALSGVVQIATREPDRGQFTAGGSAWLDSRYGAAATASLSAGWASGGLLVSGGGFDSGSGDPAGSLRRAQAMVRLSQSLGTARLDGLALYSDVSGQGFPQDSGGPEQAVLRDLERRENDMRLLSLRFGGSPLAPVQPVLSVSHSVQNGDTATPAIAPGILPGVPAVTARHRFERLEATAYLVAAFAGGRLSAGGAYLREEGRSAGAIDFGFLVPAGFALTRTTYSGFAEAALQPVAALTLNAAIRRDGLAGGSARWTVQAGLRWTPGGGSLVLFSRIGSGFKLPSLYALGHPLIGDPALKPERSRSLEAGIKHTLDGGHIALTLFDNRYRDLIDFDPASFRLTNRARVSTRGFELEAAGKLSSTLTFGGALAYVDIASPVPLRGRPAWSGHLGLDWQQDRWRARAKAQWNGSFYDSAIPTGALVTPGHMAVELGAAYRAGDRLTVQMTLRNATDNRYQDSVGVPAPGRSLRVALIWE